MEKVKQVKNSKVKETRKKAKDQNEYEQMLITMLMEDFKGVL